MPEPKLISPLLDGFVIGEPISDHHGVCCCPALREETGERFIVKVISIPASQTQLDALLLTGAFSAPEQALSYFEELAEGVLSEAETLGKLTKLEGFLPYIGAQLTEMSDGTGYQVYLLSPYKRSLRKQMQAEPLTHLGAINLSLDLCSALVSCRRAGYLYVDLKPSNIFLTQTQGWRIGDLGFVPISSLKYASLPEKYRSAYTAPEVTDAMSELSETLDVYAMGLVLYQVYNNGQLPSEVIPRGAELPPPLYADYELAEIILKACDPDPAKRWSDPAQMGQAIVSYMQRNCVNDTPIVPPPVEVPDELPEDEEEFLDENENAAALAESLQELIEEYPSHEDNVETTEISTNDEELDFIIDPTVDETAPSVENTEDLSNAFVSQEVEAILAQADELISHELPEPAVAPDPIEIPFPAPIVLDHAEETSGDAEDVNEGSTTTQANAHNDQDRQSESIEDKAITEEISDSQDNEVSAADTEAENTPSQQNSLADFQDVISTSSEPDYTDDEEEYDEISQWHGKKRVKKSKARIWITTMVIALVVAAIGYGLFHYYKNFYLQTIDSVAIDGGADSINVIIHSGVDEKLLTVTCTDTYGNTRTSSVANGVAKFTNLTPNTQYKILIEIQGLRKLIGVTSGSYTTDVQTEVLNFNGRVGAEDGSVILSFSTNGPEPENWTVHFTDEEEQRSVPFTGHTVTLDGLTVGCEYLFTLQADGAPLASTYELLYTPQKIVYAQDLKLTSFKDGELIVGWTVSEDQIPGKWNVRCFNGSGFDQSISTKEMIAQFSVPNFDTAYTIEVTADGMSTSATLTVSANPIEVTQVKQSVSADGTLKLEWEFQGDLDNHGWNVSYSVNNAAFVSLDCETNAAVIPYYPGSHYDIDIIPKADGSYISERFSFDTPETAEFEQYGVSADDLSFYMCLTPEREDWDRFDVPAEFYRTDYAVGEGASFLVEIWKDYEEAEDEIQISFIIRDQDSMPVSFHSITMVWSEMWDKRFCELDIPQMPSVVGQYTIEINFNGQHVTTKEFKII